MSKKLITVFLVLLALIAGGMYWALSSNPAVAPVELTPVATENHGRLW